VNRFFSIVIKDYLQIVRDLPGLGLLFLMPALMLIAITITQEKQIIGMDTGIKIVMVNSDSSLLGNAVEEELTHNKNFNCTVFNSADEAEKDVFNGTYQILLVVPDRATEKIRELALQHAYAAKDDDQAEVEQLTGVTILYDPAVMKIYKDMFVASLQMIVESTSMKIYMDEFSVAYKDNMAKQIRDFKMKLVNTDIGKEMPDFPGKNEIIKNFRAGLGKNVNDSLHINLPDNYSGSHNLVPVEVKIAGNRARMSKENIVNNNVPAFILFAMFFIVVSLAGSIINEKQQGTRDRFMTLPVSRATVFSGKITIYLLLCILQFIAMICIGRYIFPLISDLPPISLDVSLWALATVVVASALAAIGFGLMVGTLASTIGQAAPLGSIVVVIFAIFGGIFVPNYMMPETIRKIGIISPLRWGTDAFFSIFARDAGVRIILPQVFLLLAFFGISLVISVYAFTKKK